MFRAIALCVLFIVVDVIVRSNGDLLYTEDTLKDSHGEVIFSSVLFRHGHRTPTHQYPNDQYKGKQYWNEYWTEGEGQLTKIGKQQMYEIGKWFRKRYESLVSAGYRHDFLKEESSDLDRTIMSAQCFLAGFLPPTEDEKWADDGLEWQPMPVRQIPLDLDNRIATYGAKCDRYKLEKERLKENEILKTYYDDYKNVFETIRDNTGLKASPDDVLQGIRSAFDLYDVLFVEKSYNLHLPDWAEPHGIYPDPLKEVASLNFTLMVHTEQMQRIKAGVLIGQIVEEMEKKSKGKLTETFHIYSGHDITIAGLLVSLKFREYDGIMSPYGASVFIELRKKGEQYIVTISYRTSDTSPPLILHLTECADICTLDEFKALTEHVVPEDWQKECTITPEEKKYLDEKLRESTPEKETFDSSDEIME